MTTTQDDHLKFELIEPVRFSFSPTRREFVQTLGAGLLIAVVVSNASAQQRPGGGGRRPGGFGGGGNAPLSSRIHLGADGAITVFCGKVECGQGLRAEITQAAAEELGVAADRVTLILSDTGQTPDDGSTAGSGTTPRTVPAIRQAGAAARGLLLAAAAQKWSVDVSKVQMKDGKAVDADGKNDFSYAELAKADDKALAKNAPGNVSLTAVRQWKVLGTPVPRPNARDVVTGAHKYPSDIAPAGVLRGKILRATGYNAKLAAIDTAAVKAMKDVTLVQDGNFVGVVAPTSQRARDALDSLEKTAKWEVPDHPPSTDLFGYLTRKANIPANPFAADVAGGKSLKQTYNVAYAQHAPMEPRAACAMWEDGKLTVWTATQNPFGVKNELARAFRLGDANVRVIVPDFGGGFGGKHTGECAIEAARLAQAAGKLVSLRYTRQEEFTWAYFRPAAVVIAEASLDGKGALASWHFITVNAGGSGLENPYRVAKNRTQAVGTDAPLRQGSYRGLGSTANNFARESFMDELAALAGRDPLEFRLAHLDNPRLRAVLQEAAKRFDWPTRVKVNDPAVGVGLACGTEKGSFVAACAEVAIKDKKISVTKVSQVFECGAVTNPGNLLSQIQGALIMGLGPALREEMQFAKGAITNASFADYRPPRFADVPELDIHFLNPADTPSAGAGETPIIAIAPAIANAVFHATGRRLRNMPLKLA